jgi:hypothetical protein
MFVRRIMPALALAGWAVVMASPVSAQESKEVLLGSREVDLSLEKDRIDVTRAQGRFNGIRLYARRNGIEISRVAVTYGNGQVHNEERRINLLPGERTRLINPGNERFIDHIDLYYKTKPGTGSDRMAMIDVVGLQTRDGALAARPPGGYAPGGSGSQAQGGGGGPAVSGGGGGAAVSGGGRPPSSGSAIPENPKPIVASLAPKGRCGGPGEQLLGSQTIRFGGIDRDLVKVGPEAGKFDLIRLCVYDQDIDLIGSKVNYIQGEAQTLNFAGLIRAGYRTQEMRFKGDRFIRDIELVYKKRESYRGTALVEVWGEYAEGWVDNEAQQYRGGWVLLSSHAARFVGFEKDLAVVPKNNKGGFRKLKVDVKERDITLRSLVVTYNDGEKDSLITAAQKVEDGKSLTFDLSRGNRPVGIKEIEAVYRSRIFDRDSKGRRSIVEISAQR